MNIKDFQDYIDKKILKRGYDYYIEGDIVDSFEGSDMLYTFEIEGSEDY